MTREIEQRRVLGGDRAVEFFDQAQGIKPPDINAFEHLKPLAAQLLRNVACIIGGIGKRFCIRVTAVANHQGNTLLRRHGQRKQAQQKGEKPQHKQSP